MEFTDLEQLHGQDLARAVMREVYERSDNPPASTTDHGGLPINGTWAFNVMRHARRRYAVSAACGRLPGFKAGSVTYNMQVVYLDDCAELP